MSAHRTMLALAGCATAVTVELCGAAYAAGSPSDDDGDAPGAVDELRESDRMVGQANEIHAIGELVGSMHCIGTLVLDPRIVVTAAHCVTAPVGDTVVAHVAFRPNGRVDAAGTALAGTVWAIGSPHQQGAQHAHEAANDWAIVVLDDAPGGIVPLPIRSHSIRELGQFVGRVMLPKRPAWTADDAPSEPTCSVLGILWNLILHDCRTSRGGSGAPLLLWDGERFVVIGVHTGGVAFRTVREGAIVPLAGSAVRAVSFLSALRRVQERLTGRDEAALRPCLPPVPNRISRCRAG